MTIINLILQDHRAIMLLRSEKFTTNLQLLLENNNYLTGCILCDVAAHRVKRLKVEARLFI